MSDTRFAPVDAPERVKKTAPPTRWRNWYRALRAFNVAGKFVAAGQKYCADKTWPSKEIAEAKADKSSRNPDMPSGTGAATYIGAFPDGERP